MTAVAAKADIGHNSASVGEILDERPAALFDEPTMLQALLDEGERAIVEFKSDLTTEKGRKAIASFARKFATRKTSLDEAGKDLNSGLRRKIDVVDELRRKLRDGLDKQRDKARAPLDEYEQREDDRKNTVNQIREDFANAMRVTTDWSVAEIDTLAADIEAYAILPEVFLDLRESAFAEQQAAISHLAGLKARIRKADEDRAELERLRAEKAEAERKAAELAAAEAKKKTNNKRIAAAAKRAAEEAVEAERRKAQEAAATVEKARAEEQAKRDAEAAAERRKAQEAEAAREAAAAAERKKAQDAIDEANRKAKAAEEALEAERRAEAAKVAAAEKAKAEQARLDAERQRNQEHRSRVMKAAKEAIMDHGSIKEEAAKLIVLAIVGGSIPHVSLEF